MAAGSVLKKIIARAKQIYKSGGCTWKAAIKEAGRDYRAGVAGHHRKKTHKRKTHKRRKVGGTQTGVLYKSSGKRNTMRYAAISGRPYNGMVGGAGHGGDGGEMDHYSSINGIGRGVTHHIKHAKHLIALKIGNEEVKKLSAKTKAAKRKISKRIAAHKVQLRKLC
jgi:hypothetical protein